MIVENEYIKIEKDELSEYFGYLDKKYQCSLEIQRIILKIILERISKQYDESDESIENLFNLIPNEILTEWINVINNLYNNDKEIVKKIDYKGIENIYFLYYFPINIYKIHRLLRDLLQNGLLRANPNILDIGCGPGSATIGLLEFYKIIANVIKNINFKITVNLLDENEEFIKIAKLFIDKYKKTLPSNLDVRLNIIKQQTIDSKFNIEYLYDYIIISNLLNSFEVEKKFDISNFIKKIINSIETDGAILIIEPGDELSCENLKKIRNNILNRYEDINLYSPCSNIWGLDFSYKCTCFSNGKFKWDKPFIIKQLNNKGLLKGSDEISFNYCILRKDGKLKYEIEEYDKNYTMLKDIKNNNGQYVNVKGVVRNISLVPNYFWVSICDFSENLDKDKHYNISIKRGEEEMYSDIYKCMKAMNIGEKVTAKNVVCEQMRKYPNSYLLKINNNTKLYREL